MDSQMERTHGHHYEQDPLHPTTPVAEVEAEPPEKLSVYKRVKARAKRIRDSMSSKTRSSHDQDDHTDQEEEDGEDDEVVQKPEDHSAPIQEPRNLSAKSNLGENTDQYDAPTRAPPTPEFGTPVDAITDDHDVNSERAKDSFGEKLDGRIGEETIKPVVTDLGIGGGHGISDEPRNFEDSTTQPPIATPSNDQFSPSSDLSSYKPSTIPEYTQSSSKSYNDTSVDQPQGMLVDEEPKKQSGYTDTDNSSVSAYADTPVQHSGYKDADNASESTYPDAPVPKSGYTDADNSSVSAYPDTPVQQSGNIDADSSSESAALNFPVSKSVYKDIDNSSVSAYPDTPVQKSGYTDADNSSVSVYPDTPVQQSEYTDADSSLESAALNIPVSKSAYKDTDNSSVSAYPDTPVQKSGYTDADNSSVSVYPDTPVQQSEYTDADSSLESAALNIPVSKSAYKDTDNSSVSAYPDTPVQKSGYTDADNSSDSTYPDIPVQKSGYTDTDNSLEPTYPDIPVQQSGYADTDYSSVSTHQDLPNQQSGCMDTDNSSASTYPDNPVQESECADIEESACADTPGEYSEYPDVDNSIGSTYPDLPKQSGGYTDTDNSSVSTYPDIPVQQSGYTETDNSSGSTYPDNFSSVSTFNPDISMPAAPRHKVEAPTAVATDHKDVDSEISKDSYGEELGEDTNARKLKHDDVALADYEAKETDSRTGRGYETGVSPIPHSFDKTGIYDEPTKGDDQFLSSSDERSTIPEYTQSVPESDSNIALNQPQDMNVDETPGDVALDHQDLSAGISKDSFGEKLGDQDVTLANYKSTDTETDGGHEAGGASILNSFEKMGIQEEPEHKKDSRTPSITTESDDQVLPSSDLLSSNPVPESYNNTGVDLPQDMNVDEPQKQKQESDYTDKTSSLSSSAPESGYGGTDGRKGEELVPSEVMPIASADPSATEEPSKQQSSYADMMYSATNSVASKFGYSASESPAGVKTGSVTNRGDDAETVPEVTGHDTSMDVIDKVSGTNIGQKTESTDAIQSTDVAGKVSNTGKGSPSAGGNTEKGSIFSHISEKLKPGEDDKALSEVISGSLHKPAVGDDAHQLGTSEEEKSGKELGDEGASVGMMGKVKGWFGYGGETSPAHEGTTKEDL